jgi:hypothetical protein
MKDFIYCTIITLLLVGFCSILYIKKIEEESKIVFIWNDDEESIPMDGELIKIEYTDENTIYLCPVESEIDPIMRDFMNSQHKD